MQIFKNWKFFVALGLPIILSPLIFIPDDEVIPDPPNPPRPSTKFKCTFVLILMAVNWMLGTIPLAVNGIMPMVLFPLLGILDTGSVAINYMKETNMMFIGSLMIALAVEYSNLHKRMGLKVVTMIGCTPIRLLTGIMLCTCFLSMWMSNAAVAAMMCPIAIAILEEMFQEPKDEPQQQRRGGSIRKGRRQSVYHEAVQPEFEDKVTRIKQRRATLRALQTHPLGDEVNEDGLDTMELSGPRRVLSFRVEEEGDEINGDDEGDGTLQAARFSSGKLQQKLKLKKMLLYSIMLSSNIGGTAVLTGSLPNLVFQDVIKSVDIDQGGKYLDLSFATWMAYTIPSMCVNLFISWLYLVVLYLGLPKRPSGRGGTGKTPPEHQLAIARVSRSLEQKLQQLGPMSFHEGAVLSLFVLAIILWLTRDPKFVSGWANPVMVGDSTAALLVVLLLFIVPRSLETFLGMGNDGFVLETPPLLEWAYVQENLPWGVLLLMGGGFALSSGISYSGLSAWLGSQFEALAGWPQFVLMFSVVVCTTLLSEVTSNTACVNVLVPILLHFSEQCGVHPLYFTLPMTVASSYAFLLPVAAPTNAIVFAAAGGDITLGDMAKVMLFPTVSAIGIIIFLHETVGNWMFTFGTYEYAGGVSSGGEALMNSTNL